MKLMPPCWRPRVEDGDLDVLPLFEEPFWVAYLRNHPFYEKEKIVLRDLHNANLLLLAEGHCLAEQAAAGRNARPCR
jgi:LysR family hydrogen peroxide-inducible transcriptional activator